MNIETSTSEPRPILIAWRSWAAIGLLGAAGLWAFWPALKRLVQVWSTEPDYSHGFLVPLVAVFLLWARRDTRPAEFAGWTWSGLWLIVASVVLRAVGAAFFVEACDGWALVMWVAGITCLVFGWRITLWASPALLFLLFMIPLPFRVEHLLSQPLQRFAARGSAWMLETLGKPAFVEGNTILLHDHVLEVERACAGLRIFVGIVAVAFAAAVISRRSRVERALLLASAVPVALAANVARIVLTALAYDYDSAAIDPALAHDVAGWFMIPLAVVLIGGVQWYLSKLIVDSQSLRMSDLVDRQRSVPTVST